jgi:hypothetical protein
MKPNAKFQTCVPSNVMIAGNHLLNSNYHCDAHLLNRKLREFLKAGSESSYFLFIDVDGSVASWDEMMKIS